MLPRFALLLLFSGVVAAQNASDSHKPWLAATLSGSGALSLVSGIGGSGLVSYLGHGYLQTDYGSSLGLDANGNIYVAGLAYSQDFPLVNSLAVPTIPTCPALGCPCPSTFVAKLSPDGKTILYSTLIARCTDLPPSLAVDAKGTVYAAATVQNQIPLPQVGGGAASANGSSDAFLVKLDSSGALKAAIPIGGSGADSATSIALGADGRLYVAGTTGSNDFPVTSGSFRKALSSTQDVFLMKLDGSLVLGNQLPPASVLYSTLLGPGSNPHVAADGQGNAYLAASTTSSAWVASAGAFQTQCSGRTNCADVIAVKVNPTGNQLLYATYLGGSGTDTLGGLALDGSGSAYITGTTDSSDFPTTQGALIGGFAYGVSRNARTAFVAKLAPDAASLIYGTFLSGEDGMSGSAIAVDSGGRAWAGGWTNGTNLLALNGIQHTPFYSICSTFTPSGGVPIGQGYCPQSGYVIELDPTGSTLLWASYLGGGNVNSNYTGVTLAQPSLNMLMFDGAGNLLATGNQIAMRDTTASPSVTNSAGIVRIDPTGTSLSSVGVQTSAGFTEGLPQPGGLATVYVSGVPFTGTAVSPGPPLPTQLAGIAVLVDGTPAPIVAVASLPVLVNRVQVNFQVPFEVAKGTSPRPHIVEVQYGGQSAFVVPPQAGPGIFTLPNGGGAIQHAADYSLVTVQNPVKRGESLIMYATGLGPLSTPIASGVGSSGPDAIAANCNHVSTNAGTISYVGLTPGFPGLYQVNVQVSAYLPPGVNYFYLQSSACWLLAPPPATYQGNSVGVYVP